MGRLLGSELGEGVDGRQQRDLSPPRRGLGALVQPFLDPGVPEAEDERERQQEQAPEPPGARSPVPGHVSRLAASSA